MQIVEPLLGTRAEVHAIASSSAIGTNVENAVLQEVARLEQIFTVFDDASELQKLRRTGSTEVPELLEVIDLAQDWHDRSNGMFDARMLALVEFWDRAETTGRVPKAAALAAVIAARDHESTCDNLNAIAKGWIAQAAIDIVDTADPGIKSIWLSLGGDIVHRGSGSTVVGIEDPHRPYDNVAPFAAVEISNEALATSGEARRWWQIEGQRFPKVLDPRTGWPVDRVASATVVAADAAVADVLATIATVAEIQETLALVEEVGADCLLVHADRSYTCTSGRFQFRPSPAK